MTVKQFTGHFPSIASIQFLFLLAKRNNHQIFSSEEWFIHRNAEKMFLYFRCILPFLLLLTNILEKHISILIARFPSEYFAMPNSAAKNVIALNLWNCSSISLFLWMKNIDKVVSSRNMYHLTWKLKSATCTADIFCHSYDL